MPHMVKKFKWTPIQNVDTAIDTSPKTIANNVSGTSFSVSTCKLILQFGKNQKLSRSTRFDASTMSRSVESLNGNDSMNDVIHERNRFRRPTYLHAKTTNAERKWIHQLLSVKETLVISAIDKISFSVLQRSRVYKHETRDPQEL